MGHPLGASSPSPDPIRRWPDLPENGSGTDAVRSLARTIIERSAFPEAHLLAQAVRLLADEIDALKRVHEYDASHVRSVRRALLSDAAYWLEGFSTNYRGDHDSRRELHSIIAGLREATRLDIEHSDLVVGG